jgi:phosphoglucosamine mutase
MGRKYFGTDGIRGRVGQSPITPDFVMRLGYAAGSALVARESGGATERPAVLIGKDTRISGYMLEAALEAGFAAAGVDVMLCGPMPTPAVAYLTRALRLQAGVVISASHNPVSTTTASSSFRRRAPSCPTRWNSTSRRGSNSR